MKHTPSIISAFRNAFRGISVFFLKERNGKIQGVMGILTIVLSIACHISATEWIAILICMALVLSLEMLNSALEKLCDLVNATWHPVIKEIKDVAAASVLWASLISAIIGTIVFLPKILHLL